MSHMSMPPLRGSGSGVQRTHSDRLPLTPRNLNAPYVPPPPPRYPPDSSHVRPGGGANNTGRSNMSNEPLSLGDISQKILDEVRRGREEQKCMREELRRTSQLVSKLEEEYKKLTEQLKQQEEASFSIESSVYKDDMLKEVAVLYVRSLKRQPSRHDIGQAILKVLRQDGKNKLKFNKAKTFCNNKLTDHRCEERRRLFAQRPCEVFGSLRTEEFADRFMGTIKAPSEFRLTYIRHLALLRKFARESQEPKNDTFKHFREWLDETFVLGVPNEEEWQQITEEDDAYRYNYAEPIYHDDHTNDGGFIGENNGESREGLGEDITTYNPEMHTF